MFNWFLVLRSLQGLIVVFINVASLFISLLCNSKRKTGFSYQTKDTSEYKCTCKMHVYLYEKQYCELKVEQKTKMRFQRVRTA